MTEPTPAPVESNVDPGEIVIETLFVGFAVAIAAGVTVYYVTKMLLQAADKPAGSMVTLTLALLAIFSIAAFVATGEEVLIAVLSTAVGALAGAVSWQLGGGRERDSKGPPTGESEPPEEQEKP